MLMNKLDSLTTTESTGLPCNIMWIGTLLASKILPTANMVPKLLELPKMTPLSLFSYSPSKQSYSTVKLLSHFLLYITLQ